MGDTPADNSDLSQHLGIEKKQSFLARHPGLRAYSYFYGVPSAMIVAAVGAFAFLYCTAAKEPEYSLMSGVPLHARVAPLGDSYRSELGLQLIVDGEKSVCTGWGETSDIIKAAVLLDENIESELEVSLSVFYKKDDCRIKQLEMGGQTIPLYWQDY